MQARPFDRTFRLIHWLLAILMFLLLVTIFLRLTWLEKYSVAEIINAYAADQQIEINQDQAVTLAKKIRKPMWQWHIWLGYAITAVYVLRMLLPLFGKMRFASPKQPGLDVKTRFQYFVYLVFYVLLGASLTTGLLIEFGPDAWHETVEEIHVLSIYYFLTYMVLHLGGVFLAELTSLPGLISRIISGDHPTKSSE
ncbi:MAG: cytochrome b [Sphingobacteriaceae bacterium]|nr:cytochrome b [Sphingobacteriaceae bacterium]